jgi:hypothetical protein
MVLVDGLELPHPKAGDFESPMSTNFIILALLKNTHIQGGVVCAKPCCFACSLETGFIRISYRGSTGKGGKYKL